MKQALGIFLLLAQWGLAGAAFGADINPVRISGFGTVGAVKSDTSDSEFVPSPNYDEGADASPNWLLDSSVGAQLVGDINKRLSGTLQVLSKHALDRSYTPRTEWAFLAYRLNNHATVRAGRIGTPYFMVSDFRNINAANHWVRPPVDVYGQVPFSSADGADIIAHTSVGKDRFSAQIYEGKARNKAAIGTSSFTVNLHNIRGMNIAWEHGVYTLRVSHTQSAVSVDNFSDLNLLLDVLQSDNTATICGTCESAAKNFALDDKRIAFQSIGFQADWSQVLIMSEVTRRLAPSILADTRAWYVTGVYRMGRFSPYVTLSRLTQLSATEDDSIPNLNNPLIQLIKSGVNEALTDIGQHTESVGIRWDFSDAVDIKLQLDHVQTADKKAAGYNVATTENFSGRYNLLSASLDFEF